MVKIKIHDWNGESDSLISPYYNGEIIEFHDVPNEDDIVVSTPIIRRFLENKLFVKVFRIEDLLWISVDPHNFEL